MLSNFVCEKIRQMPLEKTWREMERQFILSLIVKTKYEEGLGIAGRIA